MQNPEICAIPLHVCRFRVTRLNADGTVAPGPDNSYVSDDLMTVQMNPNILTGLESDLIGGCGCIVATRKDPDRLRRFDFVINSGALEPGLMEMLIGATLIEDTSTSPVPIGIWYPSQLGCEFVPQPVAVEFWADAWVLDAPDPDWPYIHFLFPRTFWQIGNMQLGNDFAQPVVNGFSRTNPSWDDGPYGDQPEAIPDEAPGGFWYSADPQPTAECGYQTTTT